MAGTKAGGKKAAATNKERYGEKFYSKVGRKGGLISRGGGFASDPQMASEAGRKGGSAPKGPRRSSEAMAEYRAKQARARLEAEYDRSPLPRVD